MKKATRSNLILTTLSVLSISLHSTAYAVNFDARDTRVDMPILSTPNNAITPHMSADQAGHVYVVWSDNRRGAPSIYVNSFLPDQGWYPFATLINTGFPRPQGAPEGDATSPKVCSDDSGHVYVVWVDDRAIKAGTGKRDIFFRYSKDYGITWYPEFTDERIDTDSPNGGDSINPQIACDGGGNVYVVWQDDRNRAGVYEIYFRSLQIQFSKPVDFITYYQTPDERLNTGVQAGRYRAHNPVISTDMNGTVYVAWQDYRNIPEENIYPGIYFNVSANQGAKWGPEATRIDRAPIGGYIFFSPPAMSSDSNGYVYVAWLDNAGRAARGEQFASDGTSDVYFNRSRDYGATWDEEDERIETPEIRAEAKDVDIASNDKGVIWIVWADNSGGGEQGGSANFNIYANHSEDFGSTFLNTENNFRIDRGVLPGSTVASSPKIKVNNLGHIFVTWVDKRSETLDIYFNFSVEKGKANSWQKPDIRLDYLTPPGDSINPIMSIDKSGHVYVVWQDSRSALAKDNYNIYYTSGFLDVEILLIAGQRLGEACFIATAAYGSPFERHVDLLREFRDRYLMTNGPGKWAVSIYYRLSPPVAHFMLKHDYLRSAARVALLPAVGIAALALYITPVQKMALMVVIMTVIGAASFIIVKRRR